MPERVKLEPLHAERTSILYMHNPPMYVQQTATQQALVNATKKELIPGARRIWGTMR